MHAPALRHLGSIQIRLPLALPGQRIGLMGGSFNPPHAAHVLVAETALKRLALDQLWWIVTPGNPLKNGHDLPPLADRMAAARALAPGPRVHVTGFEADLGTGYTAQTLDFLVRRHPAVHFVWVMGADNLAQFHRWQNWRRIAKTMPLVVVDRPYWRLKSLSAPAARTLAPYRLAEARAAAVFSHPTPAWVFLTNRLSHLSSTALRNGPKT